MERQTSPQQQAPQEAKQAEAPAQDMERRRSTGERIFDWGTYSALNGVGTFIATLMIARAIKYGKPKPHVDKLAHSLENSLFKFIPESKRQKFTESFLDTGILMMGGNLMLIPVSIAEHFKAPIADFFNKQTGDKTDPATIASVPQPNLGQLVMARVQAFGMIWGSFMVAGSLFGKQMQQFEQGMGRAVSSFFKKPEMVDVTMQQYSRATGKITEVTSKIPSKYHHYGQLAALDIFATVAASLLLYNGSHKMAERAQQKKLAREQTVAPASPEAPADTATQGPTLRVSEVSRAPEALAAAPDVREAALA